MRKPISKSADGIPDKGQKVSVIAQENLNLDTFKFYCTGRCTFNLVVTGVWRTKSICLQARRDSKIITRT